MITLLASPSGDELRLHPSFCITPSHVKADDGSNTAFPSQVSQQTVVPGAGLHVCREFLTPSASTLSEGPRLLAVGRIILHASAGDRHWATEGSLFDARTWTPRRESAGHEPRQLERGLHNLESLRCLQILSILAWCKWWAWAVPGGWNSRVSLSPDG